jgi:hypothetical protein
MVSIKGGNSIDEWYPRCELREGLRFTLTLSFYFCFSFWLFFLIGKDSNLCQYFSHLSQ